MFPSFLIGRMRTPISHPRRPETAQVTVRKALAADAARLERLAALDSSALPEGDLLVAEVDGEIVAAVPVTGDGAVADPFEPTADLVTLLRLRSEQLAGPSAGASRRSETALAA